MKGTEGLRGRVPIGPIIMIMPVFTLKSRADPAIDAVSNLITRWEVTDKHEGCVISADEELINRPSSAARLRRLPETG
jgi:hypothetical protein